MRMCCVRVCVIVQIVLPPWSMYRRMDLHWLSADGEPSKSAPPVAAAATGSAAMDAAKKKGKKAA